MALIRNHSRFIVVPFTVVPAKKASEPPKYNNEGAAALLVVRAWLSKARNCLNVGVYVSDVPRLLRGSNDETESAKYLLSHAISW
jgi:hypothetical protein